MPFSVVVTTVAIVLVSLSPLHINVSALGLCQGLYGTRLYQASCQGESREIVFVSHVSKAHNAINCDAIDEADDCRENLHLQFLDKEGALLCI